MFTKQQTYDMVKTHLMKQGKKAFNEKHECKYRTTDGLMCAAGCLIPETLYSEKFEGYSVCSGDSVNIFHEGPSKLLQELGHDLALVRDLQGCHDSYQVEEWPVRLREIATDYNLQA